MKEIETLEYIRNQWGNLDYLHLKFQIDNISIKVTLSFMKHKESWHNCIFTFIYCNRYYEFTYNIDKGEHEVYETDKGCEIHNGEKLPDNKSITQFILFFCQHAREFLNDLLEFE